MDQPKRDQIAGTSTAAARNDQLDSPPPCLKLIIDCWEHIFEYLSFEDIHAMSGTCKPMHRFAGYYFDEYFPDLAYELEGDEIRGAMTFLFNLRPDFYQFISKLKITNKSKLHYILDAETFSLLKTLELQFINLTETRLAYAQNVLKNIENIELDVCTITGNIFEQLANDCPKLKYLNVHHCHMEGATVKKLLLQHYPQLEHFQFRYGNKQIKRLKVFLEKHSKLKRFTTNFEFLWANRNLLNETNVHLDMLTIDFEETNIPFDEFVNFLRSLYERGFYRTLYFSCWEMDVNFCNAIYKLPALVKLSLIFDSNIDLSRLTNLNELFVYEMHENDLEKMAKNLIHLERFNFGVATIGKILPFIRHSKKLKEFILDEIEGLDGNNVLDLFAFNEERKKYNADGCQISIGVQEEIYLPTKWSTKNLNLNHVKITRFDRSMCM